MLAELWRDIARFYHPAMRNLCGPFDRAYGLDLYPRINQLLQQMAGQGLVTRFTEADYDVPELREHFGRDGRPFGI